MNINDNSNHITENNEEKHAQRPILSYKDIKDNNKLFLSMTSLHKHEFHDLCIYFEISWNKYDNERRAENNGKGGRPPALFTIQDKLFFILFYLKCYQLQEIIGYLFGIPQSQANYWIHVLAHVLEEALSSADCLPARVSSDLLEKLNMEGKQDLVIDGTERRIQRPTDNDEQRKYYSGKKKAHTVKNLVIVGESDREVKYLSDTVEGKKHDKKVADEAELEFPKNTIIIQDSGFQGYHPEGTTISQPKKKPRGGQLTEEDKESNRLISRIRVVVENVISGIKRLHIVKDVFRNTKEGFDDLVIFLACGLHNFRNRHRFQTY